MRQEQIHGLLSIAQCTEGSARCSVAGLALPRPTYDLLRHGACSYRCGAPDGVASAECAVLIGAGGGHAGGALGVEQARTTGAIVALLATGAILGIALLLIFAAIVCWCATPCAFGSRSIAHSLPSVRHAASGLAWRYFMWAPHVDWPADCTALLLTSSSPQRVRHAGDPCAPRL